MNDHRGEGGNDEIGWEGGREKVCDGGTGIARLTDVQFAAVLHGGVEGGDLRRQPPVRLPLPTELRRLGARAATSGGETMNGGNGHS